MALSKETLKDIERETREIEARLRQLLAWRGDGSAASNDGATKRRVRPTKAIVKPVKRVTKEQRESRRIQGVYLATVRQFSPTQRKRYAAIAGEKGREKAIREMRADLRAKEAKKKAPRKATVTE